MASAIVARLGRWWRAVGGTVVLVVGWAVVAGAWPVPTVSEREAEAELRRIGAALGYARAITPCVESVARARRRFFAALSRGQWHEPRLEYRRQPLDVASLARRLAALPTPEGPYAWLLQAARAQLGRRIDVVNTIGTPSFATAASVLMPLPATADLVGAYAVAFARPVEAASAPAPIWSDVRMVRYVRRALQQIGLPEWQVRRVRAMTARIAVSPGARRVLVRRGSRFRATDGRRLVVHELLTHARRAERGRRLPLRMFRTGLPGYLDTEEGLAIWSEMRAGVVSSPRAAALLLLAVHWANTEPFSLVYRRLRFLRVGKSAAFQLALRVKRGMGDTGLPGSNPKDAAYFRGYRQVQRWVASGGDPQRLWDFGKVGLEHIDRLEALAVRH